MKKILIIEDDFYIRDVYKQCFAQKGYDCVTAIDGDDAIYKAKDKVFDVVLLDVMLPKVSGIDVLKKFREKSSNLYTTPIFLISNLGQEDVIKDAFKLGADGYFLKAKMAPENLVEEINNYFRKRETSNLAKK